MFKISTKNIFKLLLYTIPNTLLSFGIIYIMNGVISGKQLTFYTLLVSAINILIYKVSEHTDY